MAELADALASGASGSNTVQVQPLSGAPDPDFFHNLRMNLFYYKLEKMMDISQAAPAQPAKYPNHDQGLCGLPPPSPHKP